ncbi:Biotin biosynthesis cytochrome P450 [Serratia marcescens]|uniref:cytochrome P450 n=1 Tax=Serratia TaxID=613 RepID=UPI00217A40FC|nr:cytochrome P450 [Serratia marcescens]CAI1114234.1 Biotin biosynthesis cytochrome P450 [Serratia marcescens]CAI1138573.1 Biotin biosynthesis cytochrome P450 [Serratia marcescens]
MNNSLNPLSAIQHEMPWEFYARLTREKPVYFDSDLKLWVVSDAASTDAVLNDSTLQVRPVSHPVPPGIVDTPAGVVFGQLVRMREGEHQQQLKSIVIQALSTADLIHVRHLAERLARRALDDGEEINSWMFSTPAAVVASLCGFLPQNVPDIVALIAEFVLCIPASATPEHQQRASLAAGKLLDYFSKEINMAPEGTLLAALLRCAHEQGWSQQAPLIANAIGFLSQTYDATAGLTGNALLLAQRYPELWRCGPGDAFIKEAARFASPIQNTRRFATQAVTLCGHHIAQGDAVLLLLAAANRDPARFTQPDVFQPARNEGACYSFSGGRHHCPGAAIAQAITYGMLAALDGFMPDWRQHLHQHRYLPSGNARIPEFSLYKVN